MFRKQLMAGAVVLTIVSSAAMAGVTEVDVWLSIRDNDSQAAIGEQGPQTGPLEYIAEGSQKLQLDGTWQQFTFDMNNDAVTPWLGNGVLDTPKGVIDALMINAPAATPLTIWIDDLTNTVDPAGLSGPSTTVIHDWEGFADGDEVGFQEPTFSGSTTENLEAGFGTAEVDSSMAFTGAASYKALMNIISDQAPGNPAGMTYGVRYTANGAPVVASPTINLGLNGDQSVVSIWMKGLAVPEPASLSLLAMGGLALLRRRR